MCKAQLYNKEPSGSKKIRLDPPFKLGPAGGRNRVLVTFLEEESESEVSKDLRSSLDTKSKKPKLKLENRSKANIQQRNVNRLTGRVCSELQIFVELDCVFFQELK